MKCLVTGGAGYIGSIVVEELLSRGHNVVVVDNLQQGHRAAVSPAADFVMADICDRNALDKILSESKIDAIMHMAADTSVYHSVTDPHRYFSTNVMGGICVLDAMLRHHVNKIVFSSTAAVYGEPLSIPVEEEHPKNPINSYGESKLMFEKILCYYGRAYAIKHASLRYFNAAGASTNLGEHHDPETHLIPNILEATLSANRIVDVFGADYATKDGSCIRDYIHVRDIANVHILALERLEFLENTAYNLGNGLGFSVLEIVKTAEKILGKKIPVRICSRREGDPAVLVASAKRAQDELGWTPRFSDLDNIIESAWTWKRKHNKGYETTN
jgi:UDP-glucose 4-epimerase